MPSVHITPFVLVTPSVQSIRTAPPIEVAPKPASEPQVEQVAPNVEAENPVHVPQPIIPLRRWVRKPATFPRL
jgi:hypothetical protein